MYIYICAYIHTYIYMYIHTHTTGSAEGSSTRCASAQNRARLLATPSSARPVRGVCNTPATHLQHTCNTPATHLQHNLRDTVTHCNILLHIARRILFEIVPSHYLRLHEIRSHEIRLHQPYCNAISRHIWLMPFHTTNCLR